MFLLGTTDTLRGFKRTTGEGHFPRSKIDGGKACNILFFNFLINSNFILLETLIDI